MSGTRTLQNAAALLTKALFGTAQVTRLADQDPVARVLEVCTAGGKKTRLRLVPWRAAAVEPRSRSEVRVWVLDRRDRRRRDALRRREQNFIDLSGAVRLKLPGLVVDRTDLAPAVGRARGRETRNPFSDRGSLITRGVFDQGTGRIWTIRELAGEADVSLGLASYVVNELAQRRLVSVSTDGRAKRVQLNDRVALIEQWSREYDWQRNLAMSFHAPVGSPKRFLKRLPEILEDRDWALTMQAGASLVAPHASWDQIHIYVRTQDENDILGIAQAAGWSTSPEGRVVLMAPFYMDSVWRGARSVRGLPVVSTLQLILDLWHYPIRGREQAEHLITQVLSREHSNG